MDVDITCEVENSEAKELVEGSAGDSKRYGVYNMESSSEYLSPFICHIWLNLVINEVDPSGPQILELGHDAMRDKTSSHV